APVADPGRAWTTPAAQPVAAPASVLVDLLPPGPPDRQDKPDPPRARSRRLVRLAMVVVIALLAVGAAVVVVDWAGRGGSVQAAGPSGAVAAPPAPATSAPPVVLSLATMRDLVTRYYGLLPGDPGGARQLLTA